MRVRSRLTLAAILLILLSPALVFAGGDDPIYDAAGFDSGRDPLSFSDFEHIDTDKPARYDLYKDRKGNITVKPKGGKGPGEPTGININDL